MKYLENRANGILMHISSLPGKFGIGTFGKKAYDFVDFLKKSEQTYWQILPVGPTGFGDSPYQSFSTFAGNPYFIDLDVLAEDGLLNYSDFEGVKWCDNEGSVDYGILYNERNRVFEKLQSNFEKNTPADFDSFCKENKDWLEDYALFMAIKDAHNGLSFSDWELDIRLREKDALKTWKKKCSKRMNFYRILQYCFFKQWFSLKNYANENGIRIIGDIPIYVSPDSADVWANPENFDLDENLKPNLVAGCPPDGFSATGQLWGNPVYNWDNLKKDKFKWWKKRLANSLKIFDVLRIDHFRGFDEFYCIPFGEETAINGHWKSCPGKEFFDSVKKDFGELPIIAEDLGFLTQGVKDLLAYVQFPGMKILQFAFDGRDDSSSDYLPYKYTQNSIVYTGTHDNDTIEGWKRNAPPEYLDSARRYLRSSDDELREEMILCAMRSVSNTCIITMQDLLGLGNEARMNAPSSVGTNWKWRMTENQLNDGISGFLSYNTKLYGRSPKIKTEEVVDSTETVK